MYSHEIRELLKIRNNLIDIKEYCKILESPQINHIKYNTNDNNFEMWTSDNYYFKLKVKKVTKW